MEMRIELDVRHRPTGYPWHAYYGARFGWRDERAVLFRGVNGQNALTGYTRPVSPDYLEVRLGAERSFLFTGGLPFVQRHGNRMADVILVPEGEEERAFELLVIEEQPGKQVAEQLGLSVAAAYMAKSRVKRLLTAEVRALEKVS